MGSRIQDMRLGGQAIEPGRTYKVAGWAPVAEEATRAGLKPVWDVVEQWLKAKGRVAPRRVNAPRLIGMQGNLGMSS
jgi:sulfur-oxidizing protein SoxB